MAETPWVVEPETLLQSVCRLLVDGTLPRNLHHLNSLTSVLHHQDLLAYACFRKESLLSGAETSALEATKHWCSARTPALARYRLMMDTLEEVAELLRSVKPMLFKGLAVAQVYPAPWVRHPGDIDLLPAPGRFEEAEAHLRKAGWIEQSTVHRYRPRDIHARYGFARVFRHPSRPVIVDLHRFVVDYTEPFPLQGVDVHRASLPGEEFGLPAGVRIPSHSHHFVLLALHSLRHGYHRLQWFLDVFHYYERFGSAISSAEVQKFCADHGIFRAVHTSCLLVEHWLGLEEHPFHRHPADEATLRAVRRRHAGVLLSGASPYGKGRRLLGMMDIMDLGSDALYYLFRVAFPSRDLYRLQNERNLPLNVYFARRLQSLIRG